jgi:uncharacterized repeat protein (TIGR03833 family)
MNGENRSDIKRGLEVDIVLKADQRTGKLTRGIVADILTSSSVHPRGIKVRLADGQVGRVQNVVLKTNKIAVTILKATEKDFFGIKNLSAILNLPETVKEEKIKEVVKNGLAWVAKNGDQIIGYVFCEFFAEDHHELPNSIFISEIFIVENFRRQNIGKRLLEAVFSNNFPLVYKFFSITHDPEEKNLTSIYESFGFDVTGKTKAGNVKMLKKINF